MSKTQIDKAGESLRTWARELGTNPNAELDSTAIEVLRGYRQRFGLPLATAAIALSLLLEDPEKPGARLKREGAIIAKLVRYPHMRLSLGYPLKDAQGPEDLVRYFDLAAELEAQREEKGVADEVVADALSDLRKKVDPYFERRPTGR